MMNNLKLPKPLKAVFFDMDGVLYDSMKNHASTWVESFQKAGINFPAYDAYLNEGRTGPSTIEIAFRQYGNREATEHDIQSIYDHKTMLMQQAPEAPVLPGMQEIINKTIGAGIQVMVVTGSKQPSLIQRLQKDFNIPDGAVVSGFDVKKGKPDPEPYLMALEKTGCQMDEVIVIENAPMGVKSAVAAGLTTIAVNTGILTDEVLLNEGAALVLPGTLELFDIWNQIIANT